MSSINVLHVMNNVGDSSISRIVQQLVQNLDQQYFNWHVGGLNGLGNMEDEVRNLGAHVVDFSEKQQKTSSWRSIREYIIANRINIVHTHTPRAIFALYLALFGKSKTIHVTTKHLLITPSDRRWGVQYVLQDRYGLYLPDHVVAVSQTMCHQISAYPGMSRKTTAIRNAIPCDHFNKPDQRDLCRSELGVAPNSLVIGYIGRIQKSRL